MLISHSCFLFPIGSPIRQLLIVCDIVFSFVPIVMLYYSIKGYHYTHNENKYILRLFGFGLIATPIEIYLTQDYKLSFLCTLALCLLVCKIYYSQLNKYLKITLYVVLCFASQYLFEGGYNYVLFTLIILYTQYYKNRYLDDKWVFLCIGIVSFIDGFFYIYILYKTQVPILYILQTIESLSYMIGYVFVRWINNDDRMTNKFNKYFFYIAYPLQFFMIAMIKVISS